MSIHIWQWGVRIGQASIAFRELVLPLDQLRGAALQDRAIAADEAAAALPNHERVNEYGWVTTHRGKPDPRFLPVRYLHADSNSGFAKVMTDPNIAQIRGLYVSGAKQVVDLLLVSPIVALDFLSISNCGLSADDITRLGTWPALATVRALCVPHNEKLSNAGLLKLFELPIVPRLEVLDLMCTGRLQKRTIEALAKAPFENLRYLVIGGGTYISPEGVGRAILTAPWLKDLTHLSISLGLTDADLDNIAGSPLFANLERLNLSSQCFTAEGTARFLSRLTMPRLLALGVNGVNYDPSALRANRSAPAC